MSSPLAGLRVLSLAGNVPGPVAAARLHSLGAAVTVVEPPAADALRLAAPAWHRTLTAGLDLERLDLKQPADRTALDDRLRAADLLLVSMRPAALGRLGLDWPSLHADFPRLCMVSIVGHAGERAASGGHDLTYQAAAGLLDPPALPRTLLADLAGAERVVSAALALLLGRERGRGAACAEVSLGDAAADLAAPLAHGLTAPGGPLGGGSPLYGLYPARDGWVAVAALEPHFATRLATALGLATLTRDSLGAALAARTAAEWEAWAAERDVPVVAVKEAGRR
jgi:alpha-methylacyl-CoA racemase